MGKWHQVWAASLLLLVISCCYYTYLVVQVGSMNPYAIQEEMQSNLGSFGIWAFALDIIVFVSLGWWIRKRFKKKSLMTNHMITFGM